MKNSVDAIAEGGGPMLKNFLGPAVRFSEGIRRFPGVGRVFLVTGVLLPVFCILSNALRRSLKVETVPEGTHGNGPPIAGVRFLSVNRPP